MFRDLKEYQEIQKLYLEKVSKPEQLDEKPKNPLELSGALNRIKQTGAKNPLELSMPSIIKKDTTPPPETKTETPPPSPTLKADITTNQRQSRALAAADKNVKLNKFSRTQQYAADAKGVKLVPGAKVGQTVNRSTVQTKAAFDFGGVKKGERLGVLTRNQRRKYDLMAAQAAEKAKNTTPSPEKKTTTPPPEEKKVTTQPEKKTEKKIFGAADMMSGKKPTSDYKGFENVGKKNTDAADTALKKNIDKKNIDKKNIDKKNTDKKNTDKKSGNILGKSGLPNRRSFIPFNQKDAKKSNTPDNSQNNNIKRFPGSGKEIDPRANVSQTTSTNDQGQKVITTKTNLNLKGQEASDKIKEIRKRREERRNNVNSSYQYDAYDVVLEYLLSTEQAATIEEANYIMTEMDAKTIQDIVSQQLNEQN